MGEPPDLDRFPVPQVLIPSLRALVRDLAAGRFGALEADGRAGRLSGAELAAAVSGYRQPPVTLLELPADAFTDRYASAYPAAGLGAAGQRACWAVDVDLWTAEEGRSDLTLSVRAWLDWDRVRLAVEDLHVL